MNVDCTSGNNDVIFIHVDSHIYYINIVYHFNEDKMVSPSMHTNISVLS